MYADTKRAADEATDKANVAGTSEKAHRRAAAAHREAAGMTMNKEQAKEHERKAKAHDALADEYKRDELGRFSG
jgi:hypothetical protein